MDEAPTDEQPADRPPQKDLTLVVLVLMAEAGVEMGVTFTVGGATISGMLTSGKKFMDGLLESIDASGVSDEWRQTFHASLKPVTELYEGPLRLADPLPSFLHLRIARVFSGSGAPLPKTGMWWRGRLSEVQGFALGLLDED